jgi:hypothetical protein
MRMPTSTLADSVEVRSNPGRRPRAVGQERNPTGERTEDGQHYLHVRQTWRATATGVRIPGHFDVNESEP